MSKKTPSRPLSVSRVYSDVNKKRPASYWDYENHEIQWRAPGSYHVLRKIGRGKYSEVFLAHQAREVSGVKELQPCVVKVLKPVRTRKILREVNILRNLTDGPNIVRLLDCIRDRVNHTPALVFEHINNINHKITFGRMTPDDVRFYIYELLRALDYAHSQGIMHRDVKPQNIMFDPIKKQLKLIDWGLAEFYHPGMQYNVRVASRFYKGPELLVDLQDYDYSLDIWSLGCVLASIIFKRDPFFPGQDNLDQLVVITRVLGSDELNAYLEKYHLELDPQFDSLMGLYTKTQWSEFVNENTKELCTSDVFDLLDHMLVFDHQKRLSAREAMNHFYFDPIRHIIEERDAELARADKFKTVTKMLEHTNRENTNTNDDDTTTPATTQKSADDVSQTKKNKK